MPLPCSNLPLDHSRQGHSYIIQTEAREGTQDTGTPEQGTGSFFKDATFRISDLCCSEKETVCTHTHARLRLHREYVETVLELLMLTSPQQQTPIFKHTHAHTRTTLSPPKLHPTVKGVEQISAMRCLRAAPTDGAGTYDGAEPSCA